MPCRSFRAALLAAFLLPILAVGQKKPMDHSIYDTWKQLQGTQITRDGKWVMYAYAPQQGDNKVEAKNLQSGQVLTFDRGSQSKFTNDGKFVVSLIVPKFDEVKKAKKEKKKADDMPKNNLLILNLETGEKKEIERVASYSMAPEGSEWIVYKPEKPKEEPKKDEPKKEGEKAAEPKKPEEKKAEEQKPAEKKEEKKEDKKPEKKKDHKEGDKWILRNLATGQETVLENVVLTAWNKPGTAFAYATSGKDKDGKEDMAVWYDLKSGAKKTAVPAGLAQFKKLALSNGKTAQLAVLTDKDDYMAKKPSLSIYLYDPSADKAKVVAKETTAGVPKGWWLDDDKSLRFSEQGSRLLFYTQPKPAEEKEDDTLEEDKPKMDVWSWTDEKLQTVQALEAKDDLGYLAIYDLKNGKVVQLESEQVPSVSIVDKSDGPIAVGTSDNPYLKLVSWDNFYSDIYVVDVETGKATKVTDKSLGSYTASPSGRYVAYAVEDPNQIWLYDVKSGKKRLLNEGLKVNFTDELNDVPAPGSPYGFVGFTEDDRYLLANDRYDIWAFDLSGKEAPFMVTDGIGRATLTRYRVIDLDPDELYVDARRPMLLTAFDEKYKDDGFARLLFGKGSRPQKLMSAPKKFTYSMKAKDADVILYTQKSFTEYPDLWASTPWLEHPKKITDVNPEIRDMAWGTAELISYISNDGEPLQGVLYKPGNFDPSKKYPMIAYFYERHTDDLHNFFGPGPSFSTISPSLYASQGYVVFMPDIPYKIGYPGESAVASVLPGVQAVLRLGFVDPKRVGIQGQSWGGYQVAYLVTESNMFAAACAGAPVSDMFSAYGGIRWGSGLVREFQYEHGQSRIGGSIWDKPLRYLENSPVFHADKVQTPLLMMSNDADGSVPWYQGIEYFTALRRLDKPVWMVTYNGDDHNLTKWPNRKDWSVRMLQFFDHYLKGAPTPVWMAKGIPATQKGKTLGYELVQGTK